MLIPVCKLAQYNSIIGEVLYNTSTNKFIDSDVVSSRFLPVQDYVSCELNTSNIATVVGKIYKDNSYVVSFGDNFLYSLDKSALSRYRISNMKVTSDGKFISIDGKLPDLSRFFKDRNIKFSCLVKEVQSSSLGVARKFFATYKGKQCIVKFSKLSSNDDITNEILYKGLADILCVPCCDVIESSYYNKICCISLYHYDITRDVFCSFKNTNKSLSDILINLDVKSKRQFDKIMILDYLVNQQDRHLSNIALCNNKLYPAFDNGECFNTGAIGHFSSNFRKYVERLDKNYIKSLFSFSLRSVKSILPDNKFGIFYDNCKRLGLI